MYYSRLTYLSKISNLRAYLYTAPCGTVSLTDWRIHIRTYFSWMKTLNHKHSNLQNNCQNSTFLFRFQVGGWDHHEQDDGWSALRVRVTRVDLSLPKRSVDVNVEQSVESMTWLKGSLQGFKAEVTALPALFDCCDSVSVYICSPLHCCVKLDEYGYLFNFQHSAVYDKQSMQWIVQT